MASQVDSSAEDCTSHFREIVTNMFLFSTISIFMLFALNEANRSSSPNLVKPRWFIIALGASFGMFISLALSRPELVSWKR